MTRITLKSPTPEATFPLLCEGQDEYCQQEKNADGSVSFEIQNYKPILKGVQNKIEQDHVVYFDLNNDPSDGVDDFYFTEKQIDKIIVESFHYNRREKILRFRTPEGMSEKFSNWLLNHKSELKLTKEEKKDSTLLKARLKKFIYDHAYKNVAGENSLEPYLVSYADFKSIQGQIHHGIEKGEEAPSLLQTSKQIADLQKQVEDLTKKIQSLAAENSNLKLTETQQKQALADITLQVQEIQKATDQLIYELSLQPRDIPQPDSAAAIIVLVLSLSVLISLRTYIPRKQAEKFFNELEARRSEIITDLEGARNEISNKDSALGEKITELKNIQDKIVSEQKRLEELQSSHSTAVEERKATLLAEVKDQMRVLEGERQQFRFALRSTVRALADLRNDLHPFEIAEGLAAKIEALQSMLDHLPEVNPADVEIVVEAEEVEKEVVRPQPFFSKVKGPTPDQVLFDLEPAAALPLKLKAPTLTVQEKELLGMMHKYIEETQTGWSPFGKQEKSLEANAFKVFLFQYLKKAGLNGELKDFLERIIPLNSVQEVYTHTIRFLGTRMNSLADRFDRANKYYFDMTERHLDASGKLHLLVYLSQLKEREIKNFEANNLNIPFFQEYMAESKSALDNFIASYKKFAADKTNFENVSSNRPIANVHSSTVERVKRSMRSWEGHPLERIKGSLNIISEEDSALREVLRIINNKIPSDQPMAAYVWEKTLEQVFEGLREGVDLTRIEAITEFQMNHAKEVMERHQPKPHSVEKDKERELKEGRESVPEILRRIERPHR